MYFLGVEKGTLILCKFKDRTPEDFDGKHYECQHGISFQTGKKVDFNNPEVKRLVHLKSLTCLRIREQECYN